MKKPALSQLATFVLCLLIVGYISVGAQWAPPSGAPPGGNVAPPLNTGPTGQIKKSALGLDNTNTMTAPVGGYLLSLKGDGISIEDNSSSGIVDTALKVKKGVINIDSDLAGSNTAWNASALYGVDTDAAIRSHGLVATRGINITNPAGTPASPGVPSTEIPGILITNTGTGNTTRKAVQVENGRIVVNSNISTSNPAWTSTATSGNSYAIDTDGPISTHGVYASNNIATTNSLYSYLLKSTNAADPVARPVCAEKATGKLVACTTGLGESNTASNIGVPDPFNLNNPVGLFAQKVGVDLQFKSLKGGKGVRVDAAANGKDVIISENLLTNSNLYIEMNPNFPLRDFSQPIQVSASLNSNDYSQTKCQKKAIYSATDTVNTPLSTNPWSGKASNIWGTPINQPPGSFTQNPYLCTDFFSNCNTGETYAVQLYLRCFIGNQGTYQSNYEIGSASFMWSND